MGAFRGDPDRRIESLSELKTMLPEPVKLEVDCGLDMLASYRLSS